MHTNNELLKQLYTALNRHTSDAMMECYAPEATFRDIAFDLHGQAKICAMWAMICETDIRVEFELVDVGAETAVANYIARYTFSESGRRVDNRIQSHFRFAGGRIVSQIDNCDARLWAAMAIGGVPGFLAGHFRFLRSWKANSLLRQFELRQSALRPGGRMLC